MEALKAAWTNVLYHDANQLDARLCRVLPCIVIRPRHGLHRLFDLLEPAHIHGSMHLLTTMPHRQLLTTKARRGACTHDTQDVLLHSGGWCNEDLQLSESSKAPKRVE